jgi:hypothetical protein
MEKKGKEDLLPCRYSKQMFLKESKIFFPITFGKHVFSGCPMVAD